MHMPPVSTSAPEAVNYAEEIFCLNFELRTLADITLRSEAERWLHGFIFDFVEKEHLSRYQFIKDYVADKRVLDVACGSGYGTYLLAAEGGAAQVDGLDLSIDAIRYAAHRHPHAAVQRWVGDAEQYRKDGAYDVIVSFETIEHLPHPRLFLENMAHNLAPGGMLCISTPMVPKTTNKSANPYHVIEWSLPDFQQLIAEYFSIDSVYVQHVGLLQDKPPTSLMSRVRNKLFPKLPAPSRPVFEKYIGQYDPAQIEYGYQVLVCKSKS